MQGYYYYYYYYYCGFTHWLVVLQYCLSKDRLDKGSLEFTLHLPYDVCLSQ